MLIFNWIIDTKALATQKFREQQEEERRRRMEEQRQRDAERRNQVSVLQYLYFGISIELSMA